MANKIGSEFVRDFLDRGRREWGALFFNESNIAQPMYPLRGGYSIGKEIEAPKVDELEASAVGERENQSRDDPGRDERDRGIDRE